MQAARFSARFMGEAEPPPPRPAPRSTKPAEAGMAAAAKAPVLVLLRQVSLLRSEHHNKDVRGAAEAALSALYRQVGLAPSPHAPLYKGDIKTTMTMLTTPRDTPARRMH